MVAGYIATIGVFFVLQPKSREIKKIRKVSHRSVSGRRRENAGSDDVGSNCLGGSELRSPKNC